MRRLLFPPRTPDEARTLANGFELVFGEDAHRRSVSAAAGVPGHGARAVLVEAAMLIETRRRRRDRQCLSPVGRLVGRVKRHDLGCGACPSPKRCGRVAAS